jgi:hypothetical protein
MRYGELMKHYEIYDINRTYKLRMENFLAGTNVPHEIIQQYHNKQKYLINIIPLTRYTMRK